MVSKTRASARGLELRVRVARVVKGLGQVSRFRVNGQGSGGSTFRGQRSGVKVYHSGVKGQGAKASSQGVKRQGSKV